MKYFEPMNTKIESNYYFNFLAPPLKKIYISVVNLKGACIYYGKVSKTPGGGGASLYREYVCVTHPRAQGTNKNINILCPWVTHAHMRVGHPHAHELYTNLLFGKLQS